MISESTSPVPLIVGVSSFVRYGAVVSPSVLEITGLFGAIESTLIDTTSAVHSFPAASVDVIEISCDP